MTKSTWEPNKSQLKVNWALYFYVCVINLVTFSVGTAFSWPSPSLPKLFSDDPDINPIGSPIKHSQAGWIASLVLLGIAMGPFTTAMLSDRIGRRNTLNIFAVPVIIGFLVISFAKDFTTFCVARFIIGISGGAVFSLIPIYVGEIAQDHNRGSLGFFMVLFLCLGNLAMYSTGPYLSIHAQALMCAVVPVIYLALSRWIPESPHYLLARAQDESAETALRRLRGGVSYEDLSLELKVMKSAIDDTQQSGTGTIRTITDTRAGRRALLIGVVTVLVQQFSGIFAFISYMQVIFTDSGTAIDPQLATIAIGCVQLLSAAAGSAIVEHFGRKSLLIFSAVAMMAAHAAIGTYFHLKAEGVNADLMDSIFWLPIVSLVVFVIGFNVGFGSIPWMLLGEIFTPNMRSLGSSLVTCVGFLAAFMITTTFPMVVTAVGSALAFWFFGMCCLFGLVFAIVVVPETKGKSLEEIQVLLQG